MRDAWRLAVPYFKSSDERWSARILLVSIIALNLLLVAMHVILNYWNGAIFNSLQSKDWDSFIGLLLLYHRSETGFMPGFTLIVCFYIPVAIYRTYLRQWLDIRWRRWLTQRLTDSWLQNRAYYRLSLLSDGSGATTDNPDQRIADDVRSYVADTLALGLGFLSNAVSLVNFSLILWSLSGAATLLGVTIPGYLFWAALLYAIVGTWLTHLVGRPLAALNFLQQKVEANFRFALVRLRENVEGVALYGGEAEERRALMGRFGDVFGNWLRLMQRTKWVNALIAGYGQVASIFPFVVASPRYFSGQIELGGLMQTVGAFSEVQDSMSWFINVYAGAPGDTGTLVSWRATVERLASFDRALADTRALDNSGPLTAAGSDAIELDNVTLALPDGRRLLDHANLKLARGEPALIAGRSGLGKSTLFRALAGIWPYGSGTVRRPSGSSLFLPQRPYIPLGTLRHAVAYPGDPATFTDAALQDALTAAGLAGLTHQLDVDVPWAQRLSGGEQQRLAIARALLLRPEWLFLDEATASLDPQSEAELYATLRRRLPGTTIISIGHRPALREEHERVLTLRPQTGGGVLEADQSERRTPSTALP